MHASVLQHGSRLIRTADIICKAARHSCRRVVFAAEHGQRERSVSTRAEGGRRDGGGGGRGRYGAGLSRTSSKPETPSIWGDEWDAGSSGGGGSGAVVKEKAGSGWLDADGGAGGSSGGGGERSFGGGRDAGAGRDSREGNSGGQRRESVGVGEWRERSATSGGRGGSEWRDRSSGGGRGGGGRGGGASEWRDRSSGGGGRGGGAGEWRDRSSGGGRGGGSEWRDRSSGGGRGAAGGAGEWRDRSSGGGGRGGGSEWRDRSSGGGRGAAGGAGEWRDRSSGGGGRGGGSEWRDRGSGGGGGRSGGIVEVRDQEAAWDSSSRQERYGRDNSERRQVSDRYGDANSGSDRRGSYGAGQQRERRSYPGAGAGARRSSWDEGAGASSDADEDGEGASWQDGEEESGGGGLREFWVGDVLYGVSPVLAALQAGRRTVHTLYLQDGMDLSKRKDKGAIQAVKKKAEELGASVQYASKHDLNMVADNRPHQGVMLDCSALEFEPLLTLPDAPTSGSSSSSSSGKLPVWLCLDEVMDPQNFGAALRSAYFLGVDGVLTCHRNSAPLSAVVSKASSGAMELMPIHSSKSLPQTLADAKQRGWQVLGAASEQGAVGASSFVLQHPSILVMGNEGYGLRTTVKRLCDAMLQIDDGGAKRSGLVDSLNVSVATGILLHRLLTSQEQPAAAAAAGAAAGVVAGAGTAPMPAAAPAAALADEE